MPAPLNLDAKYIDALIQAILDRHAVLLEGNESRRLDRNRQRSQAWEEVKNIVQPMIDKPLTVEAVKSTFKHRQMKIKRMLQSIKDDNTDSDAWKRLPELSGLSQAETRLFHYLSSSQAPSKEDPDLVVEEDSKEFPMNSSAILRSLLALDENENRPQKRSHDEDDTSECSSKTARYDGNMLMELLSKNSPESSNEDSNNENAENNTADDAESPYSSDKEFLVNLNIPHLSTALEVSATPLNYASSNHSDQDSIVPEAVINAVVDRKAILLEDNMSRKACRNRQRCDAWEEVRQVAENASTSGSVSLDMVKGIFKYRQMKIRRIYEEYQSKTLDIQKYNLSEAEQRLFNWYCTYQPPTHHRSTNQLEQNVSDSTDRPKTPEGNTFDSSNLLSFLNQPQNMPDISVLNLQKEVLQSQKELFIEQTKMCQGLVTTLNCFVSWLNNNQLSNHCKNCHSSG